MDLTLPAGLATFAALATLVLSAIALALFFGGAGRFWGPVNDVFIAATALLLIVPMAAIAHDHPGSGTWYLAVTATAIAGAVVVAIGQLLLVAGAIGLQQSFVTGGIGVVPMVVWVLALAIGILVGIISLPAIVAILALASVAVAAVLAALHRTIPIAGTVAATALLTGLLVAWLWTLGRSLAG